MIEILRSIGNGILSVIKFIISALNNGLLALKVLTKLSLWADNWFYLLPSFLAVFGVLFIVIYAVNRILNGRN